MREFYNFRQNTDLISSSGSITEQAISTLVDMNYRVVINLLPDDCKTALAHEQFLLESNGIIYCYIPVDFNQPQEREYSQFCDILNSKQNLKMHIHCARNFRASVFYGTYAFENNQWNKYQTMSFIHDLWKPENYTAWMTFLQNHQLI